MNTIDKLKHASTKELESQYAKLFGTHPSSINQLFLNRNIAHKLQENEAGGFPTELATKIHRLTQELNPINMTCLRSSRSSIKKQQTRDHRLPIPGTIITKKYKDLLMEVKVLDTGFEYKGRTYRTLTKIAEEITGSHWSGFNFFNLE